jgi:hypothetical protein
LGTSPAATKVWTVEELAVEWQTTAKHVRTLINSGRLKAFSIAANGSNRKCWRIDNKAVAAYQDAGWKGK